MASPFLPVFFPPPQPVMMGMLFGPTRLTECLAVDAGQGGDSCSVCLCLKYGAPSVES